MPLSLLLDECCSSKILAEGLRKAGHLVSRVPDVGLTRQPDHLILAYAVTNKLIIVTKNPADFVTLGKNRPGGYPGVLLVYSDNDPGKDMSNKDIIRAIGNIELAAVNGYEIANACHKLNEWR